jgi:hypothetical protein
LSGDLKFLEEAGIFGYERSGIIVARGWYFPKIKAPIFI